MQDSVSFAISSGAICFGPLEDISRASRLPIQQPLSPRPRLSGTVVIHEVEHNVPAKNGTWNAYPLVSSDRPASVEAWFAAHETVDPLPELRKILRIAGSPYEYGFGNRFNCDATWAERVLLINRYDWGRGQSNETLDQAEDDDFMSTYNTIGLVDYAHAAAQVQDWASRASSRRGSSQHGVWMHIPDPEYMWARFGFDEEYTHARSMLFFTQRTDFFLTKFPGEIESIRIHEPELVRFKRAIREGKDYSGIAKLRELFTPPPPEMQIPESPFNEPQPPPEADLLGPYPKNEHIFLPQDIEALRESVPTMSLEQELELRRRGVSDSEIEVKKRKMETGVFEESYQEEIYDLLNELVMSYLEHFVLPLQSHSTPSTLGPALFPNFKKENKWGAKDFDSVLLEFFNSRVGHIPFDVATIAAVADRIKAFLHRQAGNNTITPDSEYMAGLVRVVAFIIMELIELADRLAFGRDNPDEREIDEKCIMVPECMRQTVYFNREFLAILQYSAVFWVGRG